MAYHGIIFSQSIRAFHEIECFPVLPRYAAVGVKVGVTVGVKIRPALKPCYCMTCRASLALHGTP